MWFRSLLRERSGIKSHRVGGSEAGACRSDELLVFEDQPKMLKVGLNLRPETHNQKTIT